MKQVAAESVHVSKHLGLKFEVGGLGKISVSEIVPQVGAGNIAWGSKFVG